MKRCVLILGCTFLLNVYAQEVNSTKPTVETIGSQWKAGNPVKNGPIRNQGPLGVCWAYSMASYFENKILNETNQLVEISSKYFVRSEMVEKIGQNIQLLRAASFLFSDNPYAEKITREYRRNHLPKLMGETDLGGAVFTSNIMKYGAVPSQVYDANYSEGPVIQERSLVFVDPHENDPSPIEKFENYISTLFSSVLFENESLLKFDKNAQNFIEQNIDQEYETETMLPDTKFNFNGKSYSPKTFLAQFLKFKEVPKNYTVGKPPALMNHNAVETDLFHIQSDIDLITFNLDHGYSVPMSFTVLSDYNNPDYDLNSTGVFDIQKCIAKSKDQQGGGVVNTTSEISDSNAVAIMGPTLCSSMGGHGVLIVNTMRDENDVVKAFIVQNSWGKIGRNILGKETETEDERGFFVIPMDYLLQAQKLHPEWAFSYQPTIYPPHQKK